MFNKFLLLITFAICSITAKAQTWATIGAAAFTGSSASYASMVMKGANPYMAYSSSSASYVYEYNGTTWSTIGTFANGTAPELLVYNNELYVAYSNTFNSYSIEVKKYVSGAWVSVFNEPISTQVYTPFRFKILSGTPYIAIRDYNNASTMKVLNFNGSTWQTVGAAGFSVDAINGFDLEFDSSNPIVVFQSGVTNKATVMKFDGTTWNTIGAANFSAGNAAHPNLEMIAGEPHVIYNDGAIGQKLSCMKFNGTSWVYVGPQGFSVDPGNYIDAKTVGSDIYITHQGTSNAKVMKYTASSGTWGNVGAQNFSTGITYFNSLAMAGSTPIVCFRDGVLGISVYSFGAIPACTTSNTITASIANTTTYLFNGQNLSTSGTYLDTLVNAAGCDSFLTLNLTVTTGTGLHFAGTDAQIVDDQIVVPHNAAYNVNAFTFEAWLKEDNNTSNNIFSKGGSNGVQNDGSYIFYMYQNKLGFYTRSLGHFFDTTIICPGTYNHVACTYDGTSSLKFYVNGKLSKTFTLAGPLQSPGNGPLGIGVQGPIGSPADPCNCNRFQGVLDDLRMWNITRTQAQIKSTMNIELAGNETGLVGYWKLNTGIAGGNNAGLTTALDASPNANHGTLQQFGLTGTTGNWVSPTDLLVNGCKKEIQIEGNDAMICSGDISPDAADFTYLGKAGYDVPVTKSFVLKNLGKDTLTITGATLTGPQASNFTHSFSPSVAKVPGGTNYNFFISCTAQAYGLRNATINILTDDCDEPTFSFALQLNANFESITINQSICSGYSYMFNGAARATTGVYKDTLYGSIGMNDTIVSLNLTVNPVFSSTINATITQGNSYTFNGIAQTTTGVYIDTLTTTLGCDSIITLNLKCYFYDTLYENICQGSSFTYNGLVQTTAGLYIDTFTTANGCDSIVSLFLSIQNLNIIETDTAICSGNAIALNVATNAINNTANSFCGLGNFPTNLLNGLRAFYPLCANANDVSGNNYNGTSAGTFSYTNDRYSNANRAGNFSTTNQTRITTTHIANFSNNFTYSAWANATTAHTTLPPEGVDIYASNQLSLLTGMKCVIHPVHGQVFGNVAQSAGAGFYVGNNGVFVLEHSNNFVRVSLVYAAAIASGWHQYNVVYDNKQPKLFIDGVLVKTGIAGTRNIFPSMGYDNNTFFSYLNSGFGVGFNSQYFDGQIDDIAFWNRKLNASEIKQLYAINNPTNVATWSNGATTSSITAIANMPTTYYCTVANTGCTDSVKVNVNNSTSTTLNESICAGNSFMFNGIAQSMAGLYKDTLINASGCDSIITLNLTINPASASTINETICLGNSFTFNGIAQSMSGVYKDTLVNAAGCDSVITLNLIVNPALSSTINESICTGNSFTFNGIVQTMAGVYYDTLVNALGCDSIITLNLSVTPNPTTQWKNIGPTGFIASKTDYTSLAMDGGTPYVAYANTDSAYKGNVMKFDGTNWVSVGAPNFTSGASFDHSLAFIGSTPYVAFTDGANGFKATVMKFDGTNWVIVGTAGFSNGAAYLISLAINGNTPYVAFPDASNGGKTTVMKYDGSSWVNVGMPGFSVGNAEFNKIAFIGNTPYVAYKDNSNGGKAYVMKFDGTNWVAVGSPAFSAGSVYYVSLAISGTTPYVCYQDVANGNKATVMKYDGTNWVAVGTAGFSVGNSSFNKIAFLGTTPYVAYKDNGNGGKATVMRYDGTNWVPVGMQGFSFGNSSYTSLTFNGTKPILAFVDVSNMNKATVMEFQGTTIVDTICGGTYTFNSQILSTTGIYYDTLVTASGCDSIITLDLTVNPISSTTIYDTICNGNNYLFNTQQITSSGLYYDTLVNAGGCDSIITLDLYVSPANISYIVDSICSGAVYSFNGTNITTGGNYSATFTSLLGGCDSTVYLTIIENQIPVVQIFGDTSVCEGSGASLTARLLNCGITNGFVDAYAANKWIFSFLQTMPTNAVLNTSNDTLTMLNSGSNFNDFQEFTLTADCDGSVSFDYEYTSSTPTSEYLGVTAPQFNNGTPTAIFYPQSPAGTYAGTVTFPIAAGQRFTIRLVNLSNIHNPLKIYNFSAPKGMQLNYNWTDVANNTIDSFSNLYLSSLPIGTNEFHVQATSISGCISNIDTFNVQVNPNPSVSIIASQQDACVGSSINAAATTANLYLEWYDNNGGLGSDIAISFPITTSGDNIIYLFAQDTLTGCSIDIEDTITGNIPSGNVALTLSSNTISFGGVSDDTQTQSDGTALNYFDVNCNLIVGIADTVLGNILGLTNAIVYVQESVLTHNNQPYCPRWFDITPASQGGATVSLYISQNDFDNYNTYASANSWPLLPSNGTDISGIANIRITKVSGGVLGIGTPSVITPTAMWNATNNYWTLTFDVDSFSQFYIHGVNPSNAPLNIQLLSFTGKKESTYDVLNWITASEQNNASFTIEHSTDAVAFTKIGTVATKAINGTSNTQLNYELVHLQPKLGHNYYRLSQTDLKGNTTINTKLVNLYRSFDGTTVQLYPNPVSNVLNVDINVIKANNATIKVFDATGKLIKQIEASADQGYNNYQIDVADLAAGIYNVQVSIGNQNVYTGLIRK